MINLKLLKSFDVAFFFLFVYYSFLLMVEPKENEIKLTFRWYIICQSIKALTIHTGQLDTKLIHLCAWFHKT